VSSGPQLESVEVAQYDWLARQQPNVAVQVSPCAAHVSQTQPVEPDVHASGKSLVPEVVWHLSSGSVPLQHGFVMLHDCEAWGHDGGAVQILLPLGHVSVALQHALVAQDVPVAAHVDWQVPLMHESVALQQSADVQDAPVAAHVEPLQVPLVEPGARGQVSPEQQSESALQIPSCATQAAAQRPPVQMFEQHCEACEQLAPVVPHA